MSKTVELVLLIALAGIVTADAASNNVTDGPHSCGGVEVPYPFGIVDDTGNGNFRHGEEGFRVACEAGKPVFPLIGDRKSVPMGNFSIKTSEVTVWLPVRWQCYNPSGNLNGSSDYWNINFNNKRVYRLSSTHNSFFILGCNTLGYLWSMLADDSAYNQLIGCTGYCRNNQSAVDGVCHGVGCCETSIPRGLIDNKLYFIRIFDDVNVSSISFSPCDYAFVVQKGYYTFQTADLNMNLHQAPRSMPVRLDWAIRDSPTCEEAMKNKGNYACISSNSNCLNSTNGPGYICNCSGGYQGNPYTEYGCTDINECDDPDACGGTCENTQGSYKCRCDKGTHSVNPYTTPCVPNLTRKQKIAIGASVVVVVSVFIIIVIAFFWILAKEKRKMKKLFQKNGGPTLEKLNNIKLFTKEDIKKIRKTSTYIGKGAFGSVYSGRIEDSNQAVAVKEPINGTSADKGQFVNEIIIQSRVIHRNIVKLVGCCLEVDIPILVYEFIRNGSLDDILHGGRKVPLSMGLRLKIAAESAEGLAYMHSKANTTILHGDVKPANILLTDDFVPKISDFGISRLIATDLQHTAHVIGDMSYMDPVYFQTGLLTKKSDVYSFGVLLLELITRNKASHSDNNSLLRNFLDAYTKHKSVTELVDKELVELDDPELIQSLTVMINQCVNLDVNQRPEMTDVEERLHEMLRRYDSK
ncbi:wall-associated receptor kinase 3-like [Lolium rigidum]|uniref:wall-associated receptor kinase 3-like n=1 Tax=Lolium rigidum TaxID=89674 RepID=UPI001F5CB319|nr:wall-associated receptor kinase 3-like [Lolium rigidum]